MITMEDFKKIDFRVGQILEAERVEGTDKLLRLRVDLGEETRQLVAGIGKYYEPVALAGKRIVVVVNLEPARIRGVASQGMLLAASAGGEVSLVVPDGEVPNGSRVF